MNGEGASQSRNACVSPSHAAKRWPVRCWKSNEKGRCSQRRQRREAVIMTNTSFEGWTMGWKGVDKPRLHIWLSLQHHVRRASFVSFLSPSLWCATPCARITPIPLQHSMGWHPGMEAACSLQGGNPLIHGCIPRSHALDRRACCMQQLHWVSCVLGLLHVPATRSDPAARSTGRTIRVSGPSPGPLSQPTQQTKSRTPPSGKTSAR